MVRQNVIFNFASYYRAKHESIAIPNEFKITDAIYTEFTDYCKNEGFTFDTKTEKQFARLKELMVEEHYADALDGELKVIESKISAEKQTDLIEFRGEISDLLKRELVSRYYYRSGEVQASFSNDPEILKAKEILLSPEKYREMLTVQK